MRIILFSVFLFSTSAFAEMAPWRDLLLSGPGIYTASVKSAESGATIAVTCTRSVNRCQWAVAEPRQSCAVGLVTQARFASGGEAREVELICEEKRRITGAKRMVWTVSDSSMQSMSDAALERAPSVVMQINGNPERHIFSLEGAIPALEDLSVAFLEDPLREKHEVEGDWIPIMLAKPQPST